jgi:hypothetical protein
VAAEELIFLKRALAEYSGFSPQKFKPQKRHVSAKNG